MIPHHFYILSQSYVQNMDKKSRMCVLACLMWQGLDICGLSEHVWTHWSAAVLLSSATADASEVSLFPASASSYLLEDGFYSDRSGGMN